MIVDETEVFDDVELHESDDELFVRVDEIDVDMDVDDVCDHVIRLDNKRVYGVEPHPKTGYWTVCPVCAMLLGQRNLGALPATIRG